MRTGFFRHKFGHCLCVLVASKPFVCKIIVTVVALITFLETRVPQQAVRSLVIHASYIHFTNREEGLTTFRIYAGAKEGRWLT